LIFKSSAAGGEAAGAARWARTLACVPARRRYPAGVFRQDYPGPYDPALLFYRVVGGIPVNELAMNFASQRIDDGYLKILIVAQALVAKMLREHPAVLDRFNVGVELNSNPVAQRNAVFHIEEKCLHCHYLARLYRSLASSADRRREATSGKGSPRLRALF
jgi:hypothetical protein